MIENDTHIHYTYLASASRSANIDRYIADFIRREPDEVIAQLWLRNGNNLLQG